MEDGEKKGIPILPWMRSPSIKTLKAFREGKVQVLVPSDAMTRGMGVEGVKRFKKMLQAADNDSVPLYSVPSSSIESLHAAYTSALGKLKETVESETSRKRKIPRFQDLARARNRLSEGMICCCRGKRLWVTKKFSFLNGERHCSDWKASFHVLGFTSKFADEFKLKFSRQCDL